MTTTTAATSTSNGMAVPGRITNGRNIMAAADLLSVVLPTNYALSTSAPSSSSSTILRRYRERDASTVESTRAERSSNDESNGNSKAPTA